MKLVSPERYRELVPDDKPEDKWSEVIFWFIMFGTVISIIGLIIIIL